MYIHIYILQEKLISWCIILSPRKNFNQDFINYIVTVQCDILIDRVDTAQDLLFSTQEYVIYVSTYDQIIFPSSHRVLKSK